jgi:hypothetical protein
MPAKRKTEQSSRPSNATKTHPKKAWNGRLVILIRHRPRVSTALLMALPIEGEQKLPVCLLQGCWRCATANLIE